MFGIESTVCKSELDKVHVRPGFGKSKLIVSNEKLMMADETNGSVSSIVSIALVMFCTGKEIFKCGLKR